VLPYAKEALQGFRPMNGKQAKRCRVAAWQYADSHGLWHKGESQVFTGLRGFFRKLFRRQKWTDAIGRWYKSNLKSLSRQAYAYIHDRDA
jgi:hypothetical protein